jgi:hypothetical protein
MNIMATTAGMLAAAWTPATAALQATLPIRRPPMFLKINIITKILEISLSTG